MSQKVTEFLLDNGVISHWWYFSQIADPKRCEILIRNDLLTGEIIKIASGRYPFIGRDKLIAQSADNIVLPDYSYIFDGTNGDRIYCRAYLKDSEYFEAVKRKEELDGFIAFLPDNAIKIIAKAKNQIIHKPDSFLIILLYNIYRCLNTMTDLNSGYECSPAYMQFLREQKILLGEQFAVINKFLFKPITDLYCLKKNTK